MRKFLFFMVAALLLVLASSTAAQPSVSAEGAANVWSQIDESTIPAAGQATYRADTYLTYSADFGALRDLLSAAPREGSDNPALALALPLPNGSFVDVSATEYAMLEAGLAAKYPDFHTYYGTSASDPSLRARFDLTALGFNAVIWSDAGTAYIAPYQLDDTVHYLVYWKHDATPTSPLNEEGVLGEAVGAALAEGPASFNTGEQLRSYRLAMAATGEYTIYHGGTVANGLAAITTTMNRVNGIYENDLSIRMLLIANNDLIVYTDPNTDPYTNNDGFAMLAQNQANLDAVIGSANYDIGHVFSTGGGGVAFLASVCNAGTKARGVTGSPNPVGDPFDVDYVAHEMGHQYGGNHTFNGTTGACGGGNRNASTAMEPGSGSTIQAYAGICGSENLQSNSDPYFHSISLQEMVNFSQSGGGNSCANITSTGNTPPTADAGDGYTIPAQTYFELTGAGTDADGDPLTYNWEQFDAGAAAPPNTDDGTRAIFRSFEATASPVRTLPKLDDILNNTTTFGESLPTTNRNLTFRLVVRDNHPGSGGIAWDTVDHTVVNTAGPFLVSSQNTATSWVGNTSETITWDVANTTAAPVSCANVDILFSSDGGYTFDSELLAATPNDGSEAITVPNVNTTTGRVKVICSDNIFFDINNVDILVESSTSAVQQSAFSASNSGSLAGALAALLGLTVVVGFVALRRRQSA